MENELNEEHAELIQDVLDMEDYLAADKQAVKNAERWVMGSENRLAEAQARLEAFKREHRL